MSIVLASASPRRYELLTMLGVKDFKVIPSQNEESVDKNLAPGDVVQSICLQKCEDVASRCDECDIVIAADTIVYSNNQILGKPKSEDMAFEMLKMLSGSTHRVYTGVAVIKGDKRMTDFEMTEVTFRDIEDDEIRAYIATKEPMDKAGAYGAQGKGSLFVEKINGDFFNVMGLPVCKLGSMLKSVGVRLI